VKPDVSSSASPVISPPSPSPASKSISVFAHYVSACASMKLGWVDVVQAILAEVLQLVQVDALVP
jgi:hypothetical protein